MQAWKCCREKRINGCWECDDFPCEYFMLHKTRVAAFDRFIAQRGEATLMDALEAGEKAGVRYHYPGKLTGDYDLCNTQDEVIAMLDAQK